MSMTKSNEMAKGEHLGELEYFILLAVLACGVNAYGLPIQQVLRSVANRAASFGTIYATLDRMERKGLVRSELGNATSERGGRSKRIFEVTAQGKSAIATKEQAAQKLKAWRPVLKTI